MNPQDLMGKTVLASDGEKIGTTGQVFLDDQTGDPEWVTVNTGLFGTKETFIPIRDASPQGGDITVPFTKAKVKGAPNMDAEGGHLSETEEDELYRYYDMGAGAPAVAAPAVGGVDRGDSDGNGVSDDVEGRTVGHDTSGLTTDEAMTRSEERLRVGTERGETGRARLRKYVTTETVSQTVPVTTERATVTREPITDGSVGKALDGPAISEEEHEVVLHAERPVVAKEAVPMERVRMGTETETAEEQVSAEVRKENIELVDPTVDATRERQ